MWWSDLMRLNEAEQSMYRSRVTEVILNAAPWIVTNDCQCFVFRLLTEKKRLQKTIEENKQGSPLVRTGYWLTCLFSWRPIKSGNVCLQQRPGKKKEAMESIFHMHQTLELNRPMFPKKTEVHLFLMCVLGKNSLILECPLAIIKY